ncbi:unnamed protein product [Cuscuta campestris]|uniref:Uncharacterized protein n=1 Tax=Cuscuta campestris TaxID=132261 RepID=A0A484LAN4_9ASTE|nr:unnamed protein product [Cuscuta campestris]
MNRISNIYAYSSVRCPRTHLVGSIQSKEASLAAGHPDWSSKLPLLAGLTCCPNSVNQGPDFAGRWRSLAGAPPLFNRRNSSVNAAAGSVHGQHPVTTIAEIARVTAQAPSSVWRFASLEQTSLDRGVAGGIRHRRC